MHFDLKSDTNKDSETKNRLMVKNMKKKQKVFSLFQVCENITQPEKQFLSFEVVSFHSFL